MGVVAVDGGQPVVRLRGLAVPRVVGRRVRGLVNQPARGVVRQGVRPRERGHARHVPRRVVRVAILAVQRGARHARHARRARVRPVGAQSGQRAVGVVAQAHLHVARQRLTLRQVVRRVAKGGCIWQPAARALADGGQAVLGVVAHGGEGAAAQDGLHARVAAGVVPVGRAQPVVPARHQRVVRVVGRPDRMRLGPPRGLLRGGGCAYLVAIGVVLEHGGDGGGPPIIGGGGHALQDAVVAVVGRGGGAPVGVGQGGQVAGPVVAVALVGQGRGRLAWRGGQQRRAGLVC